MTLCAPLISSPVECRFTNLSTVICHFGQNSVRNTTSRFARSRHGVASSRFLVQFFGNFRSFYCGLKQKSVKKSQHFWSKKIAEVEKFSKNRKIENFENRKIFEGFQLKIFEFSNFGIFGFSIFRKFPIEILSIFSIFDFSIFRFFRKIFNFDDFFRPKFMRVFHWFFFKP